MATYQSFTSTEIWQKARELSLEIFNLTTIGTFARDFSLKDQINRASGSIMDNIAEGFERNSKNEFVNFLSYSKGSCGEVRSQLYRAFDRQHISEEQLHHFIKKAESISKMLSGFIGYLNSSSVAGFKFKNRSNPKS